MAKCPPAEQAAEELVERGLPSRWWEETPAEAARYDDRHWNDLYDRDED